MPFAWTGIHLHSILHGDCNIGPEKVSNEEAPLSGANSLCKNFKILVSEEMTFL